MRIRTVDVPDHVADILRRGEIRMNSYRLPDGQLDRKSYEAVNKVLVALGGKWDKRQRVHVFEADVRADLMAALESGSIVDQKRTLEQFFTPADLARRLVDAAGIESGHDILEPSAGGGALIEAIAAKHPATTITAVELDAALCAALASRWGMRAIVAEGDFLAWQAPGRRFDRAVMNPPFSVNKDIAHVRHAFDLLKPGGRLAAIISPHFTYAEDRASREFRAFIGYPEQRGPRPADVVCPPADPSVASASVEMIKAGAFKESGTGVGSVLVVLDRSL